MLIEIDEELVEDYVNDYIASLDKQDLLEMFPDIRTRIYEMVEEDARYRIAEDIFYYSTGKL